jgi:PAS domain S-box-containing protein
MSNNDTRTVLSALGFPALVSRQADGQIVFANEQFARLVGSSQEIVVGQHTLAQYVDPVELEQIQKLLEKQGKVEEIEMQINRKNGQTIWVIVSSQFILFDDEEMILTSMVGINSRKLAETLLERRAREMETVSQVSAFVTSILDMKELLQSMVDLTKERFGLYHAHIYLLNKQGNQLDLAAGAGKVGRQMVAEKRSIPLAQAQSLVAQAARSRHGVIENNVRKNPAFLSHPLLPKTKSEMAVPMLVADKLVGVLDVQANLANHFSQESIYIYTTLAAQIAVALQNARSFEQAQKSLLATNALLEITQEASHILEMGDMLNAILKKVLATTKYEAGLVSIFNPQTGSLELITHQLPKTLYQGIQKGGLDGSLCDLVYRRQEAIVVADLTKEAPVNVIGLVSLGYHSYQGVPLRSANEVLGSLCVFCSEPLTLEDANTDFLLAVGQQIGTAVRNVQAFELAQKALVEATQSEELLAVRTRELDELTRRLTREGWHEFHQNNPEQDLRYLFDGAVIREAHDIAEVSAANIGPEALLVQPIEVRGVAIGQMTVLPQDDDADVEEVVSSVMQQLAAHIENLRLTEQVQTALAQTEALYTGSERIVLSSTEADVLESLIYSTELRNLDRANIFLFDQPVEDGIPRDVTAVAIWENEGVPRTVEVGTRFSVEQLPFMTTLTPEESVIVTDIQQDPRIDEATRHILESFGMISFVLFPMVVGSQWLGMISGQSAGPLRLNEVQQRQAGSLVSQASVVLQTTILFRQEQARARREQLLREIATKVRSSVDVDTVMRTAVTEIGRTLGRRAFIKLGNDEPGTSQEPNGAT